MPAQFHKSVWLACCVTLAMVAVTAMRAPSCDAADSEGASPGATPSAGEITVPVDPFAVLSRIA